MSLGTGNFILDSDTGAGAGPQRDLKKRRWRKEGEGQEGIVGKPFEFISNVLQEASKQIFLCK